MNKFLISALTALAILPACAQNPPSSEATFTAEEIPECIMADMKGKSYSESCIVPFSELRLLKISYIDFNGEAQLGEMVCNKAIADDLLDIFRELYRERYPIRSIRRIDFYGGSDNDSMVADNSSCFNYRVVAGTSVLSAHARGMAVDINPLENPYVKGSHVEPAEGAAYVDRNSGLEHMIQRDDACCKAFLEHGFEWGGDWNSCKDYQHFEKRGRP